MISELRFRVQVPAAWPGRDPLFASPRPSATLRWWAEAGLAVLKDRALNGLGSAPVVLPLEGPHSEVRVRVPASSPLIAGVRTADDPARTLLRLAQIGRAALHAEVEMIPGVLGIGGQASGETPSPIRGPSSGPLPTAAPPRALSPTPAPQSPQSGVIEEVLPDVDMGLKF